MLTNTHTEAYKIRIRTSEHQIWELDKCLQLGLSLITLGHVGSRGFSDKPIVLCKITPCRLMLGHIRSSLSAVNQCVWWRFIVSLGLLLIALGFILRCPCQAGHGSWYINTGLRRECGWPVLFRCAFSSCRRLNRRAKILRKGRELEEIIRGK